MKKMMIWLCGALLCASLNAQTLNEGFEGEGFPPEGWEVNNGSASYGWKQAVKGGSNCAMVPQSFGYENYLITPQLKPANGESLSFSARIHENAGGQLRIEVSLAGTETSSFELIETYSCSSKADADHKIWVDQWRAFTIDLSAYKNQRIYIAFHTTGEIGNGGLCIDNVSGVTLAGDAACEVPTAITLSDLSDESATFTWQGDAAQYQYVVMDADEAADWTNAVLTSAKTVMLTNLEEEHAYAFFVRSYCSDEQQSLAPKTAFQTTCSLRPVPWLETFTRDATGSDFTVVVPECWTFATANSDVSVVADKTYDAEGNATNIVGQAHLNVRGGGPNTMQVFALPAFNARLDTMEVAFDYMTSLTTDGCGVLEVGYMTNPSKASTFVSLETLPRTLTYQHAVVPLNDLPQTAKFIAFRFSGGTSDYCYAAMDNFIVAAIGHTQDIDPADEDVPDAAIYKQSYCEAGFTWYSYSAENFGIGLFDASTGERIAGIVVTYSECERFASEDSVMFSQYDDYENKYYCSTKWILNIEGNGLNKGEGWDNSVINVGTSASPILGLKPGSYQVQVYAYTQGASSLGELLATIPFTLVSKEVTNLQAEVANDHTTATISWNEPELLTDERLYVSVRSGETVVYDNYANSRDIATSPLTVSVEEGKTYQVTVQVIDRHQEPLGHEVSTDFTVGVNAYEPQTPTATIENGDVATFAWTATTQADAYVIVLYLEGEYYSTVNVHGATTKTTYMPEDGEWTWTVQAYEQGSNGNYFPVSSEISGNAFTVSVPDIPSNAIEANPWEMRAFYYPVEANDPDYREGKYIWFVQLLCGNNTAWPLANFIIYSDKEFGISGTYADMLNNVYMGEELTMMEVMNGSANTTRLTAAKAELTLGFEGYDQEHFDEGYRLGRYSGKYTMTLEDGTVYAGRFNDILCNSYNADALFDENAEVYHVGMWDEDPSQGIESVQTLDGQARKMLMDGNIYIIRGNVIYDIRGQRVR